MKLYPVTREELVRRPKNDHSSEVYMTLITFIDSADDICRVEDDYYNNNNDLRRAIQFIIESKNLPIHVFMRHGNTYIEKESV